MTSPAQDSTSADTAKYVSFYTAEEYELELDKKPEPPKEFKKKKEKKKVFYSVKTKKGYTIKGNGERQTIEIFYYAKKWEDPDPYIKDIYWFDLEKRKIVESRRFEPLTSRLLHGPYKKTIGGNVVEKGIYFMGTKHGRWIEMKRPKIHKFDTIEVEYQDLIVKEKYNRGWPKDSEITYYDSKKKKIKEVKPFVGKELQGEYFEFLRNGEVKTYGKYTHGQKVGKWIEYHDNTKRHYRKRVTMYPKEPFSSDEPMVIQEWTEEGKQITDRVKEYQEIVKKRIQDKYKK